jgi:ATP-binding cassette subfamily B protein
MAGTVVDSIVTVWKYVGPGRLALLVITTVLAGLIPGLNVYAGKLVLDAVANLVQHGTETTGFSPLHVALGVQLLVLAGGFCVQECNGYVGFLASKHLSLNMRCEILRKSLNLDYRYFDDPDFYDVLDRAQRQAGDKPLSLLNRFTSILRGLVTFASLSGLVLSLSPLLFACMILLAVPALIAQVKYGQRSYQLEYDRTETSRMVGYLSGQIGNRSSRPEVLSLGIGDYLFDRWWRAARQFLTQDIQLRRRFLTVQLGLELFMMFSQVASTAYIAYLAVLKSVALTLGDVMMYSRAFGAGTSSFRQVLGDVAGFYQDALFLNDLTVFNRLVQEDEKARAQRGGDGRLPVPQAIERIEFDDVSFRYPGSSELVLKNVSLTFAQGQSCLLIGSNGAGKTTLIRLLLRLYEPSSGRILINGVDIQEYSVSSLRRAIGVIFQNYLPFAFTAWENIGVGCPEAMEDMPSVVTAAKRARADEFLERLPAQYDTCLSRLFTGGTELSGGQWQRVCLARLFMKNPAVFVLDEPTASLDVETEAHVLNEITGVAQDKLCILISHRMFRAGIADHIVVLSRGTVLEEGTYDELVARNGEFARLRRLFYHSSRMTHLQETTP